MVRTTIFVLILIIVALASVAFIFKDRLNAVFIGLTKNARIKKILRRYVDNNDLLYLNNLCLRVAPQTYINIDHVIIGDRFIYVIASKFYYGYIQGKDSDFKWILCDGKDTDVIDNPLLENETKVKYLSKILNADSSIFVNIVLLSKTAHIDNVDIETGAFHLCEENQITRLIDSFENNKEYTVFDKDDLEKTAAALNTYHKRSLDDKRMNEKRWNS